MIEFNQVIKICFSVLMEICLILGTSSAEALERLSAKTEWGLMIHFLPKIEPVAVAIEEVHLKNLVLQLKDIKPDYLIFTMGQNNGKYWMANKALKNICPDIDTLPSNFDLIGTLARYLKHEGIKLIIYIPFRAPQQNQQLKSCLGDVSEQIPPPSRFLANWVSVISEWNELLGADIHGWWVDGAYSTKEITSDQWIAVCKAFLGDGQSKKLLAFNPGEGRERAFRKLAPCQNWTAGEINNVSDLEISQVVSDPHLVKHILTFVGSKWGRNDQPRFSKAKFSELRKKADLSKTMITFDIGVDAELRISEEYVDFLKN